jgi:hypothetical protein
MIAARPLRFRNGRGAACGAASLIPRRSGESRGPREDRGGLLTKMSRRGDSETQRRFRGAISAGGGSLEFSLFTRRDGRRKTAPATAPQLRTYKTAPAPPGPRASVNISARDFWAEKGWLPGRGAQRDGQERFWRRLFEERSARLSSDYRHCTAWVVSGERSHRWCLRTRIRPDVSANTR